MRNLLLSTDHCSPFGKTKTYQVFMQMPEGITIILEDGKELPQERNHHILSLLFSDAVDIDVWKHSWHLDISMYRQLEMKLKIQEIINKKITDREKEIEYLNCVEKTLMAQLTIIPEKEITEL